MERKRNFYIIGITVILYVINQYIKTRIPVEFIRWFLSCYFNDFIGGITFAAYCNMIFGFYNKRLDKLWQIQILIFISGLFWEYITPMYRENTVSDLWDIVAYMCGGFLYWLNIKKECIGNDKKC